MDRNLENTEPSKWHVGEYEYNGKIIRALNLRESHSLWITEKGSIVHLIFARYPVTYLGNTGLVYSYSKKVTVEEDFKQGVFDKYFQIDNANR